MPWQRQVADVALEIDPATNLPAYRTVVLTVPRQSGKSTLLLSVFLQRCMSTFWSSTSRPGGAPGRQRCLYTAQTQKDAREKWEDDYVTDLEASDKLRGRFRVSRASGREQIRFTNGSSVGISASTEKAGHGKVLDLPVVDEAFAQVDDRLDQAFVPAMSTRRQAQLWVVSTAGSPESLYLKAKVDAGRRLVENETTSGLAYFEWSAPEDADPDDEDAWARCMPALGHTIDLEVVRSARLSLSAVEFRRAYLNQWVDRHAGERVIRADDWNRCYDPESVIDSKLVIALDVALDRQMSAVSAAGRRSDGGTHIQVVRHGHGTDWVVPYAVELAKSRRAVAVVLDPSGPAGSLIPDLLAAGVEPVVTTARDMVQACGAFYDAATTTTLRHRRQPPLEQALASARRRELGDAWAWGRRQSGADITPLVACTLAHWGVATRAARTYDPLQSFY